jgi:inorganic pyrophosphatase
VSGAGPLDFEQLPTRDGQGRFLAVIEASRGGRNKLKYHPEWRAFALSGVLPLGMAFPYDFGFLPSTLGEDGDPIDVLVLADESVPPATLVPCRIVGVIEAEQQDQGKGSERNDRLIAVAHKSHRYRSCERLEDVAANVLDEIESFFVFYNQQRGGRFTPLARRGPEGAQALIEAAEARFAARLRQNR